MKRNPMLPKLHHIFLVFLFAELMLWLAARNTEVFIYLTLPVATVLFELSLVAHMLEKETVR